MKKFYYILTSALVFALASSGVYAATFKVSEDELKLNDPMMDDHYVLGGENTEINGDTAGDLFVLSGNVTINGDVDGDVYVLSGNVTINGNVGDDLKVAGGDVTLAANVGDDAMAAGGHFTLKQGAKVGGDLYAAGKGLVLNGDIAGDLKGTGGRIGIAGKIGGDADLVVKKDLAIGQKALIAGSLKYRAPNESVIPDGVVKGGVEFREVNFEAAQMKMHEGRIFMQGLSFFGALLIALLVVLFMPEMVKKVGESVKNDVWKTLGLGILMWLGLFFGAFALMFTVVGIPLGLIALVVLAVWSYFAKIFAAIWLSSYMLEHSKKPNKAVLFGFVTVSLLFIYLVKFIPYAGPVFCLFFYLIGFGALATTKKMYFEFLKSKKMV